METENTTDRPLTVVALGDIHAGSKRAVCPPDMPLNEGGSYHLTPEQQGLYRCWNQLAKDWGNPDVLICNGDALEGPARKDSGTGCWSTDFDDQINAAASLLDEWKAKKLYIISGTPYHTDSTGKSLEYHLGERLNAEPIGRNGQRCAEELFLRVGGVTFHASHHVSIGTGWYKTTPLARELVFALLNESDFHKTDIILRSHVHYFCGVEFHRQRGYTLPCWQLRTPYMMKKSAFGMTPSIGAMRFRIHGSEVRVDKRFFKVTEARPTLFRFEASETP